MSDRRTELRFGADQSIIVAFQGPRCLREISGKIVGASKSGLRIITAIPMETGARIEVKWDRAKVVGEVRHCRHSGVDRYSIGLKIIEVIGHGSLQAQPGAA
jgi:hypothetical protein